MTHFMKITEQTEQELMEVFDCLKFEGCATITVKHALMTTMALSPHVDDDDEWYYYYV